MKLKPLPPTRHGMVCARNRQRVRDHIFGVCSQNRTNFMKAVREGFRLLRRFKRLTRDRRKDQRLSDRDELAQCWHDAPEFNVYLATYKAKGRFALARRQRSKTNVVKWCPDTRNLYGCLPCPRCHDEHRWSTRHATRPPTILCDECGFKEYAIHRCDEA